MVGFFHPLCWTPGSWGYSCVLCKQLAWLLRTPPLYRYRGFFLLCSAESCHLSSSPDFANISGRVWSSFLFSCLCEFIFYSSSAIFMRLEERSEINVCIQPAMFNWKTRLTDSPSPSRCITQRVVAARLPREMERREGEKGGNPFSFNPSFTKTVYCDACTWYQTLIPGDISIHTQPGGGTTRGRWWAQLLSLERDCPVMVGRSGIIVCWMFHFVSEVRGREEAYVHLWLMTVLGTGLRKPTYCLITNGKKVSKLNIIQLTILPKVI